MLIKEKLNKINGIENANLTIHFSGQLNVYDNDDLFDFCMQNKDLRIERTSKGELIIMSPVGGFSGWQEDKVHGELYLWNKIHKLGETFSPSTGYILPNNAQRSADASFLSKDKWNSIARDKKRKFLQVCPDFVIEIRSQTDRINVLKDKMQEWIDNGCQLAWLIDPLEEKAYIYQPKKQMEIVDSFDKSLFGDNVLPEFILELKILKQKD